MITLKEISLKIYGLYKSCHYAQKQITTVPVIYVWKSQKSTRNCSIGHLTGYITF